MITYRGFLQSLAFAVPESGEVVVEHLGDNFGELLLHPFMSDLLRLTVRSFAAGELDLTDRLLGFMDRCHREGDEDVTNAVAVSFVEHFGAYPGESDELLARWPPALRAELGR